MSLPESLSDLDKEILAEGARVRAAALEGALRARLAIARAEIDKIEHELETLLSPEAAEEPAEEPAPEEAPEPTPEPAPAPVEPEVPEVPVAEDPAAPEVAEPAAEPEAPATDDTPAA